MKKVLKIIGYIILALIVLAVGALFFMSEKEPVGSNAAEADALAEKMLLATNHEAWDTTRYVAWDFMGIHSYLWDKKDNIVQVNWGDNEVILNTKTMDAKASVAGAAVEGEKKEKLKNKAWGFFCNDSFWLNPVSKAFDPGTERSLVTLKDGRKGLKVKYTGGGVTPGDSYVWILDENNKPVAWKMWVKIIPIGGVENTWEGWKELSTGALVSTVHKSFIPMELKNVKGGMTLESIGVQTNPFL